MYSNEPYVQERETEKEKKRKEIFLQFSQRSENFPFPF